MKLDPKAINDLWNDKKSSMNTKDLCEKYDISRATLFRVLKKKSDESGESIPKSKKLTDESIKAVVKLWNEGKSQKEIADNFSITQSLVSQIVNRKIHSNITKEMEIRGRFNKTKDIASVSVIYNC